MVRLQTPPDAPSLEVFDLTTPRGEQGDSFPWRVGMVSMEICEMEEFYEAEESEYQECYEPAVEVPDDVAIAAMDPQDTEMAEEDIQSRHNWWIPQAASRRSTKPE